MLEFLASGPPTPSHRFLCAHGAGAGMSTPFLSALAAALTDQGIATLRFEFAYMSRASLERATQAAAACREPDG